MRPFNILPVLILIISLTGSGLLQAQTAAKPLIFPVAAPPGASTWLFGQPYGNTVGAYNFGTAWYSSGQGLHFGVDIGMPCGTPLIAMADGEVMFVDNLGFGSGPHNLMVRHIASGITALYGHLLRPAPVSPGQFIKQGDVIAESGDPDITCDSRPHLHLEIRSLDYYTTYNPINYIDVNWHNLAIVGSYSYPLFQGDMENARHWLSLDDQPDVRFGGARLNKFAIPYPVQNNLRPPANPPLLNPVPPLNPDGTWQIRVIGAQQCCWMHQWHPTDPDQILVIDGAPDQRAAVYQWSASKGTMQFVAGDAPSPHQSPDGTYTISLEGNNALIRGTFDDSEYTVPTSGAMPSLSTDNTRLLWVNSALAIPGGNRPPATIYVSGIDGTEPHQVIAAPGASAQWLDAARLLVRLPGDGQQSALYVYDTASGENYRLVSGTNLRGVSIAPGGGRLLYYLTFQDNPADSSLYTIITKPDAQPQKINWFGGWRWRDATSVYYIPLDMNAPFQMLHYYDVVSGEDLTLTTPESLPFVVMNGDWDVSADGQRIVFQNGIDAEMTLLEPIGLE